MGRRKKGGRKGGREEVRWVGRTEGRGNKRKTFEIYYPDLVNESELCLEIWGTIDRLNL